MKIKKLASIFICIMLISNFPAYSLGTDSIKISSDGICKVTDIYDEFLNPAPNEKARFIVEVEGDPLLACKEAEAKGSDYLKTDDAREQNDRLLSVQSELIDSINNATSGSLKILDTYSVLLNGFSLEASYKDIEKIKRMPGVKKVSPSHIFLYEPQLNHSIDILNLPSSGENSEYTGKGQLVAVIDSSFDTEHDFFSSLPETENAKYTKNHIEEHTQTNGLPSNGVFKTDKIPFAYDYGEADTDLYLSSDYHGTHVAGIIGGYDKERGLKGVAPNVQLALMKVTDKYNQMPSDVILSAMEDAVLLDPVAINISLGIDYLSPGMDEHLEKACTLAKEAGILTVCAAGNKARGFFKNQVLPQNIDYSAICSPASSSDVMAVASALVRSQDGVLYDRASASIAPSSAWGVSESLELKPEITAPGEYIYSAKPSSSHNEYYDNAGTSMAAPHIAGIAALMGEFFTKAYPDYTVSQGSMLTEYMLMSTANILKQKNNVPFSPRQQGAGLANVTAAMETKVILTASDGSKPKISLGDGLANTLPISFKAVNISQSSVSYDSIRLYAMTDGLNGSYIGNTTGLHIESSTLPKAVTINANSTETISGEIVLSSGELSRVSNTYKNGFFIDGFIELTDSSGNNSSLSIPFTGFHGDWAMAPIFDRTEYDAGGSILKYSKDNKGSYLYSGSTDNKLGYNGKDGYSEEYIAISPNGDGINEDIGITMIPMRTYTEPWLLIFDENEQLVKGVYYASDSPFVFNKYSRINLSTTHAASSDLSGLSDGNYFFAVQGCFNYPNAVGQLNPFDFYIDKTAPEMPQLILSDDDTVIIRAKDNRHLSKISLTNNKTGTAISDFYELPPDGGTIDYEVSLDKLGLDTQSLDKLDIAIVDKAGNTTNANAEFCRGAISLTDFVANHMNGNTYALGFKTKSALPAQSIDVTIALYDGDGALISCTKADATLNGMVNAFVDVDKSRAVSCKLFIWKSNSLAPLDISKNISMKSFK